jgi:hypothetical protein
MSKEKSGSSKGQKINTEANTRLADIYTAAKSTMEPHDYEQGYPPNEGRVLNANFGGRSKAPGGKG